MSHIIKVRCNGAEKHINEVDLDEIIKGITIARGKPLPRSTELQQRYVIPCKFCANGRVIIKREMIEDYQQGS